MIKIKIKIIGDDDVTTRNSILLGAYFLTLAILLVILFALISDRWYDYLIFCFVFKVDLDFYKIKMNSFLTEIFIIKEKYQV